MRILAVILLLTGILNIAIGGCIAWSDFKPHKNNAGITYIALGIFMIEAFSRFF